MTYSPEILIEIEGKAYLGLTISEIAILLDLDQDKLQEEIDNNSSLASKAFRKGCARAKEDIARVEMNFAVKGSPQAIKTMLSMASKQKKANG